MRFSITLLATLFCLTSASFAAPPKRDITEKDLFDFVWIGDMQISPDGSRVAFVRVSVNEKHEGYNTSIWLVPADASQPPRRLTSGEHDSAPRWSPDGSQLIFARATEHDGKPEPPQLCLLSMSGGEAFSFTSLPKGAGNPVWSPDGKSIAFLSTTNADDLAKQEKKKQHKDDAGKKTADSDHESDVHVITRAIYRSNDEGYLDPKHPTHIWVVQAPRGADEKVQPKQLTTGRFEEESPVWSKDGAQIYFTSLHVDEPYYELGKTELYSISATGGEPTKINTIALDIQNPALSPDGKQLAFIAAANQPVNSYTQPDLWTLDLAPNAQPRNLTATFDYDVGAGVFGDNGSPRAGGGNPPVWSTDGKSILEIYSQEGRTNVARFDATTGAKTDLTQGNQAVARFRTSKDSAKLVCLVSTPTRLGDLFVSENGSSPRQITDVNADLFNQLTVSEPEEIWYQSFDGKRIQAWLQKPPGFDPHKKYPLILNIHGGPHAAYGFVFDHEFQWMAAKGYLVLYPNPRGSTSYGQNFGNVIQFHYPGDDYKDLVTGVDEMIKRGYVDEKKLGVTGGSGGGLLTDWVVGRTDRFAAAVAQRDIASWSDWWYTADFTLFQPTWFKAPPFEDPEDFKARSPITYIEKVKTPMMFILGETDSRTPSGAGGEQMFRALKYRKIPTVMVKFPNETHELSRSGQPWHRIERLEHIVGWFDKWLTGAKKPEYDVAPEEAAKPNATTPPPA